MKRFLLVVICLFALGLATYWVAGVILKPSIQYIGISSDSIVSMADTLIIDLKFEDIDGDIGDSVGSLSNVYIEDSAYNVVQEFPIVTNSATHTIGSVSGKLKVQVNLLPLLDTCVDRIVKLNLYITDRKGQKSNSIKTPAIHLSKRGFDRVQL